MKHVAQHYVTLKCCFRRWISVVWDFFS